MIKTEYGIANNKMLPLLKELYEDNWDGWEIEL